MYEHPRQMVLRTSWELHQTDETLQLHLLGYQTETDLMVQDQYFQGTLGNPIHHDLHGMDHHDDEDHLVLYHTTHLFWPMPLAYIHGMNHGGPGLRILINWCWEWRPLPSQVPHKS